MKMEVLFLEIKKTILLDYTGVLYNIKSQNEWHTHNEVNGLSLSDWVTVY